MFKKYLYLIFLLAPLQAPAQNDWSLKVDKEGIRIYTKYTDKSKYKAIKTVCNFDASLGKLTAVLMDAGSSAQWVYSTKSATVLKHLSPNELVYHSEVDVPWPFSNRDFIVKLAVTQDPKTKVVTVSAENKPAWIPEKRNVVRIQYSHSSWRLEPLPDGKVKAEFTLQTDPGGNIPAWLINMFATKGPLESFKNLKELLKKTGHAIVSLPFIRE